MDMQDGWKRARPAFLLMLVSLTACDGQSGLGLFNPVDEDYSRPSPEVTVEGALERSCDDEDALAQEELVFDHALCLCGDLEEVGQGLITRSASYFLGNEAGLAHVGINGYVQVVGNFEPRTTTTGSPSG